MPERRRYTGTILDQTLVTQILAENGKPFLPWDVQEALQRANGNYSATEWRRWLTCIGRIRNQCARDQLLELAMDTAYTQTAGQAGTPAERPAGYRRIPLPMHLWKPNPRNMGASDILQLRTAFHSVHPPLRDGKEPLVPPALRAFLCRFELPLDDNTIDAFRPVAVCYAAIGDALYGEQRGDKVRTAIDCLYDALCALAPHRPEDAEGYARAKGYLWSAMTAVRREFTATTILDGHRQYRLYTPYRLATAMRNISLPEWVEWPDGVLYKIDRTAYFINPIDRHTEYVWGAH